MGFELRLDHEDDLKRPFVDVYIRLRDIIERYKKTGNQPILQLTPIYTGGGAEYERLLRRNYLADPDVSGDPLPSAFAHRHQTLTKKTLILNKSSRIIIFC